MTYTQNVASVDAAFRRKGQLIKLTLKTAGGYLNGKVQPASTAIVNVWGIETGLTTNDLGVGNVKGTLIQAGDRKLTLSALTDVGAPLPEIHLEDTATVGTKVYAIKNVDALQPGGVAVMYTLIGRG
jgi:hypothetical protein